MQHLVQLLRAAVFYKLILDTHAHDAATIAVLAHIFRYCATQSAFRHAVFYGHDSPIVASDESKNTFVDGFEPTHVPMLELALYVFAPEDFVQGLFAGVSNIVTSGIIGSLLCAAYAAAKPKKGSLKEEE